MGVFGVQELAANEVSAPECELRARHAQIRGGDKILYNSR
jgi:hypothetical protein